MFLSAKRNKGNKNKVLGNLEVHRWKKAGGKNWGSESMLSTVSCSEFMAEFESGGKINGLYMGYKKLKEQIKYKERGC